MTRRKISLPTHESNKKVWNAIEAELDNSSKLRSLKKYQAAESVWENIQKELPNHSATGFPLWLKLAATVLFLLGCTYILKLLGPLNRNAENNSLTYKEEWVEPSEPGKWDLKNDKEISFLIEQKEAESAEFAKSKEFQLLKAEYYRILEAKQTLMNELSPYEDNKELELILTRIELQKGAIARSLISYKTS